MPFTSRSAPGQEKQKKDFPSAFIENSRARRIRKWAESGIGTESLRVAYGTLWNVSGADGIII
ncbi:MAG TPA: hypothetical protein VMB85_02050 [Bryobacteraceae bacterium]|nr:hypothetical protein [Bryobacteraceae bacterium]